MNKTQEKPIVKIKNAWFEDMGQYYRMLGEVQNHPRFTEGEIVCTSRIIKVETKNTIYELVED